MFSLNGKIALVTGASYGIGFAIAQSLAGAGAKIVFNDIKQELVDKGLEAYKAAGIDAKGYVCDVTNEDQVNSMVADIEKEVGVIDILVNNAGIAHILFYLDEKRNLTVNKLQNLGKPRNTVLGAGEAHFRKLRSSEFVHPSFYAANSIKGIIVEDHKLSVLRETYVKLYAKARLNSLRKSGH